MVNGLSGFSCELDLPVKWLLVSQLTFMINHAYAELSNQQLLVLDAMCEEFEQSLKNVDPVSIEQQVERAPDDLRFALFAELLAVELEFLTANNIQPSVDDYLIRFPQHEEAIRQTFATCIGTEVADDPGITKPFSVNDLEAKQSQPATCESGHRFRVLAPHAKGGAGEVSVAKDCELNRVVALKHIHARYADDDFARQRFLMEAEITGRLEHPGVVPVYSLGQYKDGRPYYAMRLIKGESLQVAVEHLHNTALGKDEKKLLLRKLLGRFVDVCNTIQYAHSRGVLHRDLKPSNIMLGDYGETLVVDWGLAKLLGTESPNVEASGGEQVAIGSDGQSPTLMGTVIGTPAYMPPEQAAGRMDELAKTSDVFSLGATLYHILTGQPPHSDRQSSRVLQRVISGDFKRPHEVAVDLPAPLEAICMKAMSSKQLDRYATPQHMGEDIEAFLAGDRVSAYSESPTLRFQRWVRLHPRTVTGLAATLLMGLIGTAVLAAVMSRNNYDLFVTNQKALLEAKEAGMIRDFFLYHLRESQLAEVNVDYGDPGADVIELNLRSQSRRAEIMTELGDVFGKMGDLRLATKHLMKAAAIRESLPEASDSERQRKSLAIADSNFHLGVIQGTQGRADEGLQRLESTVDSFQKVGIDPSDRRMVAAKFFLTTLLTSSLSMQDAKRRAETYRTAANNFKELEALPNTDDSLAAFKMSRGIYKYMESEQAGPLQKPLLAAQGYALFEEARKLSSDLPDDHSMKAGLAFYDAFLHYEINKGGSPLSSLINWATPNGNTTEDPHKQFIREGEQAISAVRRAWGKQNAYVLQYELKFAQTVPDLLLKRRLLQNCLDASRVAFGNEPELALSMNAWADFLEEADDYESAEQQLKEVVDLMKLAFDGQPHWRTGLAKLRLGQFLVRQKRWPEASLEFQSALTIFDEVNVADYSDLDVACRKGLQQCLKNEPNVK